MDSKELVIKNDLAFTTSTRGWKHVVQMAEETVAAMERKAIDEDDDIKGASLRREAKAARVFMTTFLNTIEIGKQVTTEVELDPSDDDFYEVCN